MEEKCMIAGFGPSGSAYLLSGVVCGVMLLVFVDYGVP